MLTGKMDKFEHDQDSQFTHFIENHEVPRYINESPEHQESEAGEHGGGDGGEDDGVWVPGHQLTPPGDS